MTLLSGDVDGGGGGGEGGGPVGVGSIGAETHRRLATLLREDLLPLCPTLLSDEDPIPLYALKLLGGRGLSTSQLTLSHLYH